MRTEFHVKRGARRRRSGRAPSARRRAASTARGARRASCPGPVPHQSSEPSESLACSEPCEPPPMWCDAAPVEELPARARRREHLAGRAAAQRRPDAPERVRVARRSVTRPSRTSSVEHVEVALDAPASRRAGRSRSPRGAKRSSPRSERTAASPSGWSVRCIDEVDALEREQRAHDPRHQRRRARRGRARRPAAARELGHTRDLRRALFVSRTPLGGSTSKPSNARKRSISSSTWDCEWSEQTITAWSSRNASGPPAACIRRSICWSAAASDVTCASGPCLCECVSLSGSDSSRKSNRSCSTRYCADAARVLVAHARQAELRAAAGLARREDVGVEELARAVDGLLEDGRGDPRQRGLGASARAGGGRGTSGRSCRRCARRRRRASRTPSACPPRGARRSCCRSCR